MRHRTAGLMGSIIRAWINQAQAFGRSLEPSATQPQVAFYEDHIELTEP
ncbi:hypothetical protein FBY03_101350 [Pseudomonas sp. SJZ079]|nr:hypothetical protein FBY03_101350 [Pseudomonas sp. SJZ079]